AQRLGIRDFQLDSEGSGLTTSVVASGKLSERLSLRYGVGVFEPANTIALRYELSKRWYLEAASGLASSLDIFYKRDF
ncbi:MAG TPA: translocation/assembly module TamB domain-containing protein, partial [Pseudomonas sp.]|nr:translocation/assembly module TamB domain-containing protein [Pseudomonas sp.]